MSTLASPIVVGFLVGLVGLYLYFAYRSWDRLRHINGPPTAGWSTVWILCCILGGKQNLILKRVCEKYGTVAKVAPNMILCNDPSEFRRVYSVRAGFYRPPWYEAFRFDPNRDSILTMTDNKAHHRLRANLLPGYSGRGMENQEEIVDEQVLKLISLIERKYVSTRNELRPLDLVRSLQYLTQDVISSVGFGKSFGYLDDDADTYGVIETGEAVIAPLQIFSFFPFIVPVLKSPLVNPFLPKPTDKYGMGRMLGVVKQHVDTRYGPNKITNNDTLQAFVESDLDRDEVEAEALIQLIGGTDTTATALRCCIFYLASSAKAYGLLQGEIDAAAATMSTPVISDRAAKSLPYLQAVIKEGLRMWPPIMGIHPRMSDNDEVICGVKVPAKTNVGWSVLGIMRNKAVFGEDADTFDPGRWLDGGAERLREMEATQGMVFLAGSRWECLGKRLAYVEMGKVLFELFRRYDFAMMDPVKPFTWENWGLSIHHGMTAKVTKRDINVAGLS